MMESAKGDYYCPVKDSGQYDVKIPAGATVRFNTIGTLRNVQTGRDEAVALTGDEYDSARWKTFVDFADSESIWVKLRNTFGLKTRKSVTI
jgi:hypothetical protein